MWIFAKTSPHNSMHRIPHVLIQIYVKLCGLKSTKNFLEENNKILEKQEIKYIIQVFSIKKLRPGIMFQDKEVFPDKYAPPQCCIHIFVQLSQLTTTGKCFSMVYLSYKKFTLLISCNFFLFN